MVFALIQFNTTCMYSFTFKSTLTYVCLFVCLCWGLRHFDSIAFIARRLANFRWRKTLKTRLSCTDEQLDRTTDILHPYFFTKPYRVTTH